MPFAHAAHELMSSALKLRQQKERIMMIISCHFASGTQVLDSPLLFLFADAAGTSLTSRRGSDFFFFSLLSCDDICDQIPLQSFGSQ
jgi:hypothetical protein